MTMAIEDVVCSRPRSELFEKTEFSLKDYKGHYSDFATDYPFPYLLWIPFLDRDGGIEGGMLLARENAWPQANAVVCARLGKTFAHALRGLRGRRRRVLPPLSFGLWFSAAVAALIFVRVPVTAMAPFEIVARNAQLVAAPLDGTIEQVLVTPGSPVAEGQVLLTFSSETLKSKLHIAQQEVLVAEANLKQAAQMAFTDESGRRELAIATSQVDLKVAERNLAEQLLARTTVRAEKGGVSLFTSPDDLVGRPVVTGEKLMKVADPQQVEAGLEVALSDSSLLQEGTRVKLFFDADPLHAQEAVLASADYKPKPDALNVLNFKALAALDSNAPTPRLGARGTAQLIGSPAPLGFVLLRRPLAALRQRIAM